MSHLLPRPRPTLPLLASAPPTLSALHHARLHQYLSTSAASRQQSSSSPGPSSPKSEYSIPLRWDPYFRLRKQRKWAGQITTIPTTLLSTGGAGSYFLARELDPTSTIAGIDPVYISLMLTFSFAGLGYLIGPTVGISLWNTYWSKLREEIENKDRLFYEHIKQNRVDAAKQTMQNRLPDYYGENISSIKDYRQWLRDQAAFRRKAAHGVDDDEKLM